MTDAYRPKSRRPIAQPLRRTATTAVALCCRLNVHPDLISYLSVVASLIAAVCFWYSARWPWLLLVAPLFCYARLYCNMLDGMVALASGKASRRGELLNELPDRVSDLLVFVSIAHSGLAHMLLGYWAGIAAVLTAYVGTLGQAAGAHRDYSGLMSKPWRMVVVHAGAWATFFMPQVSVELWRGATLSLMDVACVIIILGCVQTMIQRLVRIVRALSQGT
ncbi:MAG TPA: CDP-alcohol phosphatidyltransferase family protein [Tepidisphaeraceae bacterium]|nr:CDP-alcohol phosphatidyltransferase family protein [Tepidisphaeraceae bacterium]